MSRKVCTDCRIEKSCEDFARHPNGLHGRQARCRSCYSRWMKAHRAQNLELYRGRDRLRRAANPEKYKQRDLKRCQVPERRRANAKRARRWYLQNRERTVAAAAAWAKEHPDRNAELRSNIKAKRRGAGGPGLKWGEWPQILECFGHRCAYCLHHTSVVGKLQQDHVIPLARGGTHCAENIVPACSRCNRRKAASPIWEMLRTE